MKKKHGNPLHPIQPLVDVQGVTRFKENAIVQHLLKFAQQHEHGLNELAAMDFSDDDREQFAQLIGYSLCGFGDLGYVTNNTLADAQAQPVHDGKADKRTRTYQAGQRHLKEYIDRDIAGLTAEIARLVQVMRRSR